MLLPALATFVVAVNGLVALFVPVKQRLDDRTQELNEEISPADADCHLDRDDMATRSDEQAGQRHAHECWRNSQATYLEDVIDERVDGFGSAPVRVDQRPDLLAWSVSLFGGRQTEVRLPSRADRTFVNRLLSVASGDPCGFASAYRMAQ